MNITTKHISNANGRSQILAKGGGKQRTVNLDHSKSNDWNHGTAAGTLLLALDLGRPESATHEVIDTDTHVFKLTF